MEEKEIPPPEKKELLLPTDALIAESNNHRRRRVIFWILAIFLLLGLICFCLWFFWLQFRVFTDDAYVNGNRVLVKPQVSASVTGFFADDNDWVEEGQVLVTLDTTIFAVELDRQKQNLDLAARQIRALAATLREQQAQIVIKQAILQRAQEDYDHRRALIDSQAVSLEDLEHSERALEAAKADLESQHEQKENTLARLGVQVLENHPTILAQKANVRKAFVDLYHCQILAPATGYVARRNVQVGDYAVPANTLMSIIPFDQMWIEANYKESQLRHIRLDQPVKVRVDLYGFSPIFHGRVAGIQSGTGSAFSLIPPQNATGNWIKIVQRVPVRIYLEPEDLKKYPLRIGLSCETFVDTSLREGPVLRPPNAPPSPFIDKTDVYDIDLLDLEKEMDEIINRAFTE